MARTGGPLLPPSRANGTSSHAEAKVGADLTTTSLTVTVGLSVGWGDVYAWSLPDQYVDITGLTSGQYRLATTADRPNWFRESNNSNNRTWVDLQLKGDGGIRVIRYGPAA